MRHLVLLAVLLSSSAAYAGSGEVGFFTADEAGCLIENRNVRCAQDEGLVEGDMLKVPLTKKPEELRIRFISKYAQLAPVVPGKFKVTYHAPKKKNVLVALAMDFLGFNRDRSRRWTYVAATRGAPYQPRCQRPAEHATLLPGQPVTFSWCRRNAQRIVVRDPDMKVVFARPVRGLQSVQLAPEELSLRPGVTYSWDVVASPPSTNRDVKMLDAESAAVVRAAFEELEEKKDLEENEKLIAKASFVQHLTERYPEEVGLTWLSYQLLEELDEDALTDEERGMVRYLKRKSGVRPCGI